MSAQPPESLKRRRPSLFSPVWLVPLASAAVLGWFIHREMSKEGPIVEISFIDGDGLQPQKTDLRYRGVKIGEVKRLDLSADMTRVIAKVELEHSAEGLAREGSQFWIVRPEVSAGGVKGLGAVISGAYLEALPGSGPKRERFSGLEQPPAVQGRLRGLQIFVVTDRPSPLDPGAPVLYRGIKVGAVADSSLTSDSTRVRSRVVIERPYQALVREGSRFWNAGGVQVHLGLKGLDVSAKSLSALLAGGIAFATPDPPGKLAGNDRAFDLAEKADDAWLKWRPKIPLPAQPPESER